MDANELELAKFKEELKNQRIKHIVEGIVVSATLVLCVVPVVVLILGIVFHN